MAKLTRYANFKELKMVEKPSKTDDSEEEARLSQFKELLTCIRNEFVAQNAKSSHGK